MTLQDPAFSGATITGTLAAIAAAAAGQGIVLEGITIGEMRIDRIRIGRASDVLASNA